MSAVVVMLAVVLAGAVAGCDDPASTPSPSVAAIDSLLDALAHGTRTERAGAVDGLAELGDPAAVPALAEALADEDWTVRWRAAETLVILHDGRAVEALLTLIAVAPASPAVDDDDLSAARAAYQAGIRALGAIGDVRAVQRLVEIAAVKDWTPDAGAAEEAIAAIGGAGLPAITDALAAAPAEQAARIVPLLARLGEAGLAPLITALGDKQVPVGLAAATALVPYDGEAVDALVGALKAKDRSLRLAVAEALGDIGDPKATAGLVVLLADTKAVGVATRALVRIHGDDGTPLVRYLKAKKTVGVYRALIRIGDADTVAALVKALKAFGSKTMGEAYLNCGNPSLEKAAKDWGKAHGYTVVTSPGAGAEAWGGG